MPGFPYPANHVNRGLTENWELTTENSLLDRLTLHVSRFRLFVRHRLLVRSRTQHFFHADVFGGVDRALLGMVFAGCSLLDQSSVRSGLHIGDLLVGH